MRPVFGQKYKNDRFLSAKCEGCIHCERVGFGTRIVDGERRHFNQYGCADIDRTVKCLEDQILKEGK